MPVVTRSLHETVTNDELKQRLIAEWKNGDAREPRPTIIQETDAQGNIVHIYVVWSDWGDCDQRMRSELITDAYWEVFDDKALALTVAMGLTPEEAKRMGFPLS
ncbi:MAG: hypothetical protein IPK82_34930 [Polyangiaceae bacterium]|nr:hypothetical protein [Polyangiaceae bacterium]